jgi:hypothetical protein
VAERERLGGAVLEFEGARLPSRLFGGFPGFLYRRGRPRNFRALFQLDDAGVGDLPAEGLYIALLLVALFQEDGLPGVGGQIAGCGQDNVPGAVSDHDATA